VLSPQSRTTNTKQHQKPLPNGWQFAYEIGKLAKHKLQVGEEKPTDMGEIT